MDHWYHNRRVGIELSRVLGNTNTDEGVARRLLAWAIDWDSVTPATRFLEPAVGAGSFVFAIVDALVARGADLAHVCARQIVAADVDPLALERFRAEAERRYGAEVAASIRMECRDFLTSREPEDAYDWIVTNPPYVADRNIVPPAGWEKDAWLEAVRARLAVPMPSRADLYALFHARALDLLAPGGRAVFLCADTWIDAGFGEGLVTRLVDGPWALETVIHSQLMPFFRDDTNAIFTVIRRVPEGDSKPDVAVLNLRVTSWEQAEEAEPVVWSQARLASVLRAGIPNRRNAFLLFPEEYARTDAWFASHPSAWAVLGDVADVRSSPVGAAMFPKDKIGRARRGPVPVFWQLQARTNRPADYRTHVPSADLTLWVSEAETCVDGKPAPFVDEGVFVSTVIDRFPLVFHTDRPVLHVSKYLAVVPKEKPVDKAWFAACLESVPAVLSMEQLLKEGTRKTLRVGEKGLAKEINKPDLERCLVPVGARSDGVRPHVEAYQGRVIANLEDALRDADYWAVQVHLARTLGYLPELLWAARQAVFLYVLRMRHLAKLSDFDAWYRATHGDRLAGWTPST